VIILWFSEPRATRSVPLDHRSGMQLITRPRPQLSSQRDRYRDVADVAIPEAQAVDTDCWSFVIGAAVNIPGTCASRVLKRRPSNPERGSPPLGDAVMIRIAVVVEIHRAPARVSPE
jgi:hypothetical protein